MSTMPNESVPAIVTAAQATGCAVISADRTAEPSAEQPPICEMLDILGAKWSILVISGLSSGPKRFKQLLRELKIVKTQSLTDALRHLEKNGLVLREVFPTVPVTVEYSLTVKGVDFLSVLAEMDRWVLKWKR